MPWLMMVDTHHNTYRHTGNSAEELVDMGRQLYGLTEVECARLSNHHGTVQGDRWIAIFYAPSNPTDKGDSREASRHRVRKMINGYRK